MVLITFGLPCASGTLHVLSLEEPLLLCPADSFILKQPLLQEASIEGLPFPKLALRHPLGPEPHTNSLVTLASDSEPVPPTNLGGPWGRDWV